jgi:hypothetical protein
MPWIWWIWGVIFVNIVGAGVEADGLGGCGEGRR